MAILAALIAACDGRKPLMFVQLYKAFYFAHLVHMKEHGAELTGWRVAKMPQGPGVDRGQELIDELVRRGVIRVQEKSVGPYTGRACEIADKKALKHLLALLNDREQATVRTACGLVRDSSAKRLSDLTHQYSRAWNAAKMGGELPIYADLLLDDEQSDELRKRLERAAEDVGAIF